MMKRLLLWLCWIAALAPLGAHAQKTTDYEFDNEKPWAEIQAQLPPYPKTENLLQFDAGPASANSHYVDISSLSVGEDGVVRFSLVIKSASGAMNVSYEGIRCQTAEKKTYAYGRNNNTWLEARASRWTDLENVAQNYAQRTLYRYFFCPLGIDMVRDADEAIQALKAGVNPRAVRY
jgi:CNP1-like family